MAVGTHGRGAYIIDNIRPLRAAAQDPTLAGEALRVLPVAPAQKYAEAEAMGYGSVGHAMMFGEMRPYGALISYWVDVESGEGATIDILDGGGSSLRTLSGSAVGVNRVVWDLRRSRDGGLGGEGPEVLGGAYEVRVTLEDAVSTAEVTVLEDTREDIPAARRTAKLQAIERARSMTSVLSDAQQRVERAIRAAETVQESLLGREGAEDLREEGAELHGSLEELHERLLTGPPCQGICGRSRLPANAVRRLLQRLTGSPDAPTANERLMLAQAEEALRGILDQVNAIFDGPVSVYSRQLKEAGYSPYPEASPLTIPLERR